MEIEELIERLTRRPFIPKLPDEHLDLMQRAGAALRQSQTELASLSDQLQHRILCRDAEIAARGAALQTTKEENCILEKGLRGAMAEIARLSRKWEFGDSPESAASRTEAEVSAQ